jgi:hypothetical protein
MHMQKLILVNDTLFLEFILSERNFTNVQNRAVIDSVQSISTIYRYQVTNINDTPIYR